MPSTVITFDKARSYYSVPGRAEWGDTENALDMDDRYATANLGASLVDTEFLVVDNGGAVIPSDSTVVGIKLYCHKHVSNKDDSVRDNEVYLTVDYSGPLIGENKPAAGQWPDKPTTYTYGGEGDMWDYAWTPSIINKAKFGAMISAGHPTSFTTRLYVDCMWVEVFWSDEVTRWPSLSLCTDTEI